MIDIDVDDPALAQTIEALAVEHFGTTLRRWREGSSRVTLLYRAAEGSPPKRVLKGEDSQGVAYKIEVLSDGQQTVVDGLHPGTKAGQSAVH
jgi:hypothetical protein